VDNASQSSGIATVTITIAAGGVTGGTPVGRGDTYATPVGTPLNVTASRLSGVLYNDFDTDPNTGDNIGNTGLTATLISGPTNAANFTFNSDGSFSYTPNNSLSDNDNDSFTYKASDGTNLSAVTKVNIAILSKQTDFKIMMNYELGMHCTGFEFAYCCVLPPYNSILAQVVKPQPAGAPVNGGDFPRLLEGDPNNTDGLGRPTVVRDAQLDGSGKFKKYFLEYYHDAQPRHEGQGKPQTSTLISDVEGNSMFYTSTIFDSAQPDAGNKLVYGPYEGAYGVVQGSGVIGDAVTDNYANGWLNHFYIYVDPATGGPNLEGHGATGLEADKIRLGVSGQVEYPANVGAALQPMGPTGAASGFDNVLTFSGDTGTVVYTQMKVLEDLPIMLTSPKIWEALGLPLTPFEDSINFFSPTGPGSLDEDSIRPYVAMKAALHVANCDADGLNCTEGAAVIGSNGKPVIGHGTAPIDIPNCERCHSVPAMTDNVPNVNSPSYIRSDFAFPHGGTYAGQSLQAVTDAEISYWNAYYNITVGVDSDWYSRLKGAAINMLSLHDFDNGTGFTSNWPSSGSGAPQNTRLGKESVICQKCHADNVIAVVKSAYKDASKTQVIKPITEAIHHRHREVSEGGSIDFSDAAGRSGGCQGCHPAHRSDGVMDGYPITYGGDNAQAMSDNRLNQGGCFVGRDVHSNPMKDVDGAETPAHLNAVGSWLASNVFYNQDGVAGVSGSPTRGLWCTNCHSQLGQEIWKKENCPDLINGNCITNPRGASSLSAVASAVGVSQAQAIAWLDPTKDNPLGDFTHAIWDPAIADANLATIEVNGADNCNVAPYTTSAGGVCVKIDADGDPSVRILDFCTTSDCVASAQTLLNGEGNGSTATPVPFSAATDARDHWLAPGEPHCADCHAAPYVEPSGGNAGEKNFKPPFNYPRKASLMRYSTGHQGVTCQGCHESIHGLYPVTPAIDTTSYAQAAALNADGSHGPLKCGTCHTVDSNGIPTWIQKTKVFGRTFDDVTGWAHTYTDDASPLDSTCQNCHGDRRGSISEGSGKWLRHSFLGRVGRATQDKAEIAALGHVAGDPDVLSGSDSQKATQIANTVCTNCHSVNGGPSGNFLGAVSCSNLTWKQHLVQGRLSHKVWEFISTTETGTTCSW
jgi:mono/diheme cytochrome c family protein